MIARTHKRQRPTRDADHLIEALLAAATRPLSAYMVGAACKDIIAICRQCASVTPVPICNLAQQIRNILASEGCAVEYIIVEAQGRCQFCLGKATPN